ncbi:MAG: hypothetical protein JJ879_00055 [Sneathiella sp.]|nr:hypothetical protein [Sneathiella sp.]
MGINTEKMTATLYDQILSILQDYLADKGQDHSSLKLRPPRDPKWGDLSSNILQLTNGDPSPEDKIIPALENISAVASVKISSGRDLNIFFDPSYWTEEIIMLSEMGVRYGAGGYEPSLNISVPAGDADLMALKRRWTAEALSKFAKMLGGSAQILETEEMERSGFNASAALAKCGEQTLRLAILTHDDDFAIHFSPAKALDRSYDAPAFLLPYTYATIHRLLDQNAAAGEDVALISDEVGFSGEEEMALVRHLIGWPQILHKSLSEQSLVNLTGFLTGASLLFFELYKTQRLQSSDYLTAGECAPLRRELLNALAHLLEDALEALGHDRVKEFI